MDLQKFLLFFPSSAGLGFHVTGPVTFDPTIVRGGLITPVWYYGDGTTGSGLAVTHDYAAGTYLATLTPPSLYPDITRLDMNADGLSGSIPSELSALTSLALLYLYNNNLTGAIPSELSALTSLTHLLLSGNNLTGAIPSELSALTSLTVLYLYGNNLTGAIPSELSALTSLTQLLLYSNSLSGIEAGVLGPMVTLSDFQIQSNGLLQAVVDEIVDQIYTARATYTDATPAANLSGTNDSPTGAYTDPLVDPGAGASNADWLWNAGTGFHDPLTEMAEIFTLVNDHRGEGFNKWTITL